MTMNQSESSAGVSGMHNLPEGRVFDLRGVNHVWRGFTADRPAQLMGPNDKLLLVPDPTTGFPTLPTELQLLDLIATHDLVLKSDPLKDPVRNIARRQQLSRKEIEGLKTDRAAVFRMKVLRKADRDLPMLGDKALAEWRDANWDEQETRATFGCWPCGSTLRGWIVKRGRRNDRRYSDATSQRGKARSRRTDKANLAVAFYHAMSCYDSPGKVIFAAWALYAEDLKRLCAGNALSFAEGANIPRPAKPQKSVSYETFRKLVHQIKNPDNVERKWGRRGRRKGHGGGGAAPEPTRPFEIVQIDDTPFPAWCVIDNSSNIVAGVPLVTVGVDVLTGVIAGWDVECGPPSVATVMRTIHHCASPKVVPPRYRERYPGLASIGGKVGTYLFDNALQNAARAVEDMAGDTCTEVQWAGEDEPTHKQLVERTLQTLQSFLAKELDSYSLDENTRRELNLDPKTKAIVTLATFRMLLDEAIATIHVTCDQNKADMVPLARFELATSTDEIGWVSDLDEFAMAIGDVEYDVTFDRAGLQVFDGLRHSDYELTPILLAEETSRQNGRAMRGGGIKVKVKYRPDDISQVFLWSEFRGEYVPLPCTRPLYAAGLSKWMHERIRSFVRAKALAFNTEEERLAARAGLVELCRSVAAPATDAERRLKQRVLVSPMVRQVVGAGVVDLLYKPASPTGREMPLLHDLAAPDRRDRYVVPPRRQRGTDQNHLKHPDDEKIFSDIATAQSSRGNHIKPRVQRSAASPTGREKAVSSKRRREPPQTESNDSTIDTDKSRARRSAPNQTTNRPRKTSQADWDHYE